MDRSRLAVSVATAALVLGTTLAAAPAHAVDATSSSDVRPQSDFVEGVLVAAGPERTTALPDQDLGDPRTFTTYRITNVTKTENTVGSKTIARCVAATDGTACTISAGISVGSTVGVSLGATAQMVTASLSASVSTTVTLSVGCSSPALTAGQSWNAYPVGTAYSYQIQRRNVFTGTTTSGTLTAFIPDANGIACGVA